MQSFDAIKGTVDGLGVAFDFETVAQLVVLHMDTLGRVEVNVQLAFEGFDFLLLIEALEKDVDVGLSKWKLKSWV